MPELVVTTPLERSSSLNRNRAWNAPRALKAPARCKFSHLKKKLILGCAGVRPSKGVPTRAFADCGEDASADSVFDVSTGVRWIWGFITWWADWTEALSKGAVLEMSAIALRPHQKIPVDAE